MSTRIQAYMRTSAARDRDVERIGPFTTTFSRHSDNPYLNDAIPDEAAEPTSVEAAALIEAYKRRGLVPRLEYLPGLAPAVEPAPLAAHSAGAGTVFLTPAGDPQERVYARVGYRRIDSVLFLSRWAS